jgi:hypothetical protein
MLLSEEEIARIFENEMARVLFSDDPADWDYRAVALVAAHAIAEKLKEGVVWEGLGTVYRRGEGRLWLEPMDWQGDFIDGQLVELTVAARFIAGEGTDIGGEMTDYYVQVRKGGVWHRKVSPSWTRCGRRAHHVFPQTPHSAYRTEPRWAGESPEPREPLCKRCLRSKR